MTWLLVACWLAAIVAMAFALEYLSAALFAAGMVIGIWDERRNQLARDTRTVHRQLLDELKRHE